MKDKSTYEKWAEELNRQWNVLYKWSEMIERLYHAGTLDLIRYTRFVKIIDRKESNLIMEEIWDGYPLRGH
jgi:hypothetical protein